MTQKALKLALEALDSKYILGCGEWRSQQNKAITAIREALAQPEQEPVAWLMYKGTHKESYWLDKGDAYNFEMTAEHRWEPLYTTPPQRKPLTGEQIEFAWMKVMQSTPGTALPIHEFARAIEAKLKEKNGA